MIYCFLISFIVFSCQYSPSEWLHMEENPSSHLNKNPSSQIIKKPKKHSKAEISNVIDILKESLTFSYKAQVCGKIMDELSREKRLILLDKILLVENIHEVSNKIKKIDNFDYFIDNFNEIMDNVLYKINTEEEFLSNLDAVILKAKGYTSTVSNAERVANTAGSLFRGFFKWAVEG